MSTAARRWLLLFVVLAAIGGGSAVALGATDDDDAPSGSAEPSATATATPTATAAPAGSSAAASSSAGQDPRATSTEVVETEPPTDVATDEPQVAEEGAATLQVGYAGLSDDGSAIEVNAFVVDRIEDGGTCGLTLSRGERSHEATAPAFADASTTICGPLTIATSALAPGMWEAVVSYGSDDATGTSETFEVTVP